MTIEEIVRQQTAAINRHDSAGAAGFYTATAGVADPQYPEQLRGTEAISKDFADWFTAFPDFRLDFTKVIGNGDTYAIEGRMSGTHQGPLLGPAGHIPATNKRVELGIAVFGRLDGDGRVAEEHRYYDLADILGQLGLMG
jgi:steroid delta-isomerase-like uncharacterized protein